MTEATEPEDDFKVDDAFSLESVGNAFADKVIGQCVEIECSKGLIKDCRVIDSNYMLLDIRVLAVVRPLPAESPLASPNLPTYQVVMYVDPKDLKEDI